MRGLLLKWVLAVSVLAVLVAGCGSDDEAADSGADTEAAGDTEATDSGDGDETADETAEDDATADEPDPVELQITWWGGDSRHEATVAAIELFEAANPHIDVVAEFQGWDGYWDKIATLTAAGNAPDVYQHNFGFFGEYVERDALLALDTRAELDLTGWDESIATQGTSGSSRFALPTGANVNAMVFDPAAVEAAGVDVDVLSGDLTWEEFGALAAQISDSGGDGFYGVNDSGGITDIFEVWLKQQGKQIYNDDGTLGFEAADAEAYWEYWNGMRDSGAAPPIDLTTQIGNDLATHPLSAGIAAMHTAFSSQFKAYSEASGLELAVTQLPNGGDGADGGMANIATGLMWSASADTDHPAEAAMLINFLVNDAGAIQAQGLQRGVPLSQSGRDLLEVDVVDQLVIDYISAQATSGNVTLDSVLYTRPPLGSSEVGELFATKYEEVAFGASSAADAATSFILEAEEILAEAG